MLSLNQRRLFNNFIASQEGITCVLKHKVCSHKGVNCVLKDIISFSKGNYFSLERRVPLKHAGCEGQEGASVMHVLLNHHDSQTNTLIQEWLFV